jgi:hypothetical protein
LIAVHGGKAGGEWWLHEQCDSTTKQRRRFSSVTAPLLESAQVQPGIIFVATLELGFLPPLVGINIFLASFRLRCRVLEVCLAVPFASSRGRSARDYVRNLADDNAS